MFFSYNMWSRRIKPLISKSIVQLLCQVELYAGIICVVEKVWIYVILIKKKKSNLKKEKTTLLIFEVW